MLNECTRLIPTENSAMKLVKIRETDDKDLGAFARVDIPDGTLIVEYWGKFRYNCVKDVHDVPKIELGIADSFLDARDYGGIARFLNHICRHYNCIFEEHNLEVGPVILARTIKDVMKKDND